jgi:hydroxymethylpyrimidine pyrophosphatase-like HAD family hydrolase
MISWIFDVDGVLCDTGSTIDPEFKAWFLDWSKDKKYYLTTGGEWTSTIKQLGSEIVDRAKMSFHCMGNYIVLDGEHYKINQIILTPAEQDWFNGVVSKYPYQGGERINMRQGSLNFALIGRDATLEQKLAYAEWDNINEERTALIDTITKRFPRFSAYIGGNASIDICLRKCDKSAMLDIINYDMAGLHFFGDKCFDYGIDSRLAGSVTQLNGTVHEVNGYKQTWEILKQL